MIPRQVQLGAAVAWVGLATLALLAPSALPGEGAFLYLLLPLVVGFLVGRWPAVALALVPALLSIPLGRNGEDAPFVELLLYATPWLAVPMLLGVVASKLTALALRRRGRSAATEPTAA